MFNKNEDSLSLEEVVKICKNIKHERIEVNTDPITKSKTTAFLDKYLFFVEDVRNVIKSLESSDYIKGPVQDTNPIFKHPFWIFIKDLGNIKVKVYIKIKIIHHKSKIIVFSFHEEGEYDL